MKEQPMREKMLSKRPRKYIKAKTKQIKKEVRVQSAMEKFIADYLTSINEKFIAEKQFPDLVSMISGVNLNLDFYLPNRKIAIEYDGQQHFKLLAGEKPEQLERRRLCDLTKDLFCKQRGIVLLRIKYSEKNYYREIIQRALKRNENDTHGNDKV